jgi:ATP/maltotriose-dependent transcriptional regulator MalT
LNDPQIAESQLGRVPGRITEALAAALNELATEGLLVVDDVHELPPSLVKATVATLLRARPRHLKTLIITGAAESESLGKLVSEGKIRRIDRKCFQVDAALTAKYLLRRFDRTIPEPICQKLAVVTEGWPMALVLIDAEDVASDEALEALLQELEASPGRTYDVLLTRAYQRQDAAVQRVLKAISVSRRVTPEWLNSVLGTADGGATLRLLSTSNAFVLRSETSADDWRLQALFRTFLRQRLVDEEGEAARRRWFERSYGYWEQRSEYLTATW